MKMIVNRLISPAIAILMMLTLLPAGMARSADTLRFGVLPVVDTLPLWVGVEEGHFAAENIQLELVSFQSALELEAAMQAGRLDGFFGDLLNTLLLLKTGQRIGIMTTVLHSSPENRLFALVTAPGADIITLHQMKGQAVAISRATIIEFLLDRFLEAKELPGDWVVKQEIKKMPIRVQMLLAGQVPAALLPEPLITLAETKGAKVLMDDRELDASLTVLALKRDLVEASPDLKDRFLAAYQTAVTAVNAAPEKYRAVLTANTRVPKPVENQFKIPPFPPVELPTRADIVTVQGWLKKHSMLDQSLAYGEVVFSGPTP